MFMKYYFRVQTIMLYDVETPQMVFNCSDSSRNHFRGVVNTAIFS